MTDDSAAVNSQDNTMIFDSEVMCIILARAACLHRGLYNLLMLVNFAPLGLRSYCNQYVCLSVGLSVLLHNSKTAQPNVTTFFVHVARGRG